MYILVCYWYYQDSTKIVPGLTSQYKSQGLDFRLGQ
jgi:hypothetical protein